MTDFELVDIHLNQAEEMETVPHYLTLQYMNEAIEDIVLIKIKMKKFLEKINGA